MCLSVHCVESDFKKLPPPKIHQKYCILQNFMLFFLLTYDYCRENLTYWICEAVSPPCQSIVTNQEQPTEYVATQHPSGSKYKPLKKY